MRIGDALPELMASTRVLCDFTGTRRARMRTRPRHPVPSTSSHRPPRHVVRAESGEIHAIRDEPLPRRLSTPDIVDQRSRDITGTAATTALVTRDNQRSSQRRRASGIARMLRVTSRTSRKPALAGAQWKPCRVVVAVHDSGPDFADVTSQPEHESDVEPIALVQAGDAHAPRSNSSASWPPGRKQPAAA